ncbi:phosphoenolpyruvate synthase [Desulfovibrio sp. OttesenSCG-928-G11]|nr:phosphoenolpyruvate synthase [Desulfovibrio sp. OttesenSCG-928-G11]
MGIFDSVSALFKKGNNDERQAEEEERLRRAFKARCGHFRSLLSANKRVLATMASLEEYLRGDRLFGMNFVRAGCTDIVAGVFNMVRHLNSLSGDAYQDLFPRLKDIQQRIADITSPKAGHDLGPLVLPLGQVDMSMAHEVGGKMASLGEAAQKLGRAIPAGFVVTASGFRRFIDGNRLQEEINRRIQLADLGKLESVFALSSSLQQLIISSPVPEDLAADILSQYLSLAQKRPGVRLAVRSSAIGEDAHGTSFAGQYRSELNITGDILLETYKEVVASKYGVTAMSYRVNRGIPDDEVPMCVGCLEMINAESGGVAYSNDPLSKRDDVVINAVLGLPRTVVDGSGEVDVFRVAREPFAITRRDIAVKKFRLDSAPEEGVIRKSLSGSEAGRPSLTDAQTLEVAQTVIAFEDFYGMPQDMEWAYDQQGQLVILQSRALPGFEDKAESKPLPEGAVLLMTGGVCAGPGIGAGEIFLVRRDADMLRFPSGAVLLVEQAHARWAPVLSRAAAVISDYGGTAGHLASVAREYGVPALFGLEKATERLAPGREVTVDADSLRVLDGRVEEALEGKREPRLTFSGSPVYKALEAAAEHIVPLNLLDPEAPEFAPAHCRTIHDITRFCHEKAVEEMFRTDHNLFSGRVGKQLKYKGSKLQYFVVNMESGFREPVEGPYIEMEQICCPPMHALWRGMLAIPWTGPVGAGARSFLSLVAESAGNPELEITSASTRMMRNYFLVDSDYCNLQASFGYHFCTIEAQAGENEQENYVNFHFKGGAANIARRALRVEALADVLTENGFIVDVKEDALSARAEELADYEALELLVILGYLIIHTRQMDAALSGERSRTEFADMLRKGVAETLRLTTPA